MSSARTAPGLRTGTWTVAPSTTRAMFQVRDVLHRWVYGTLAVTSGSVGVDAQGIPSSAYAEVDLASVATGSERRDKDLRGRSFLDVQSSPRLVFSSGPATAAGPNRWTLPGRLAMKGMECPVLLQVQVTTTSSGARVRATTTLDRRQLGISAPRLLVGSEVVVTVEADLLAPAD